MKHTLEQIALGDDLTREQASVIMSEIMEGVFSDIEIGGFLMALKTKGEKAPELAGFADALRSKCVRLDIDVTDAVDCCGTGGEGSGSFNISTAAAIVAASAGARIAKHGNRSVSSRCGSADLLERAGIDIDPGPDRVKQDYDELGLCFMFAPRFHPAFKHAAAARQALSVRTVFNMLGPLVNPAHVRRQLLGVYSRDVMELFAEALIALGCDRALVVHSHDGLDEISAQAPTDCIEVSDGKMTRSVIDPEESGVTAMTCPDKAGGPDENNSILQSLLAGEKVGSRSAVIINSAAILYVAGCAASISEGSRKAAQALDSGAARDLLERWKR
ncbi:MAG: anthranilate phosphoribosyltransferase [candidate division Zixibacteria bacterium]|nr:anthranilate phosphoribosyltransferase [candidate division Zixibacteria bacterium]